MTVSWIELVKGRFEASWTYAIEHVELYGDLITPPSVNYLSLVGSNRLA